MQASRVFHHQPTSVRGLHRTSALCGSTDAAINKVGKLHLQHGGYLAYHKYLPVKHTARPGIVFCEGFLSRMTGLKGSFLADYCKKRQVPYVRFDYEGHGNSSGDIEDSGISRWKDNTLSILRELTDGPQIIVGSSIGAWIMLLVALEMPGRIKALVGLASAPDSLYRRFLTLTDAEKAKVEELGYMQVPVEDSTGTVRIAISSIRDAKKNLLLNKAIPVHCAVRLLHGMQDALIPFQTSIELSQRLLSQDVQTILIKDGEHRLSREKDLKLLEDALDKLYNSM